MTMKHKNLPDTVLAHLERNAGHHFQCAQLARHFAVDHKTMRNCLDELSDKGAIRSILVYNKREFYVPTAEQDALREKTPEARYEWKPLQMNPVLQARAADAAAHRAQYPSGPSGAAQEMSELDRNKLAFIGATN